MMIYLNPAQWAAVFNLCATVFVAAVIVSLVWLAISSLAELLK